MLQFHPSRSLLIKQMCATFRNLLIICILYDGHRAQVALELLRSDFYDVKELQHEDMQRLEISAKEAKNFLLILMDSPKTKGVIRICVSKKIYTAIHNFMWATNQVYLDKPEDEDDTWFRDQHVFFKLGPWYSAKKKNGYRVTDALFTSRCTSISDTIIDLIQAEVIIYFLI